ncbi:type II toxin-antitoxin system RelE/ParE family toxin [Serratia liquefaciens]|uniref:type II toxin-antitoxin system RelE/ParE family toxin n=1 Tax=Serratia liquefaciens TaxID=614 RepID=UPI0039068D6D
MWQIVTVERFDSWFLSLNSDQQKSVLVGIFKLQEFGPLLARPHADTLNHKNQIQHLKELRIQHRGRPFRIFFAFDPQRQAALLCCGDKTDNKRFYQQMLPIAIREFPHYLATQR